MNFTGLVKGTLTETQVALALAKRGAWMDVDFHSVVIDRVTNRHDTVHRSSETHFRAYGFPFPPSDVLERAIHAWFQEPGEAPFPEGTLLHFSYCDVKHASQYRKPGTFDELEGIEPGEVGC